MLKFSQFIYESGEDAGKYEITKTSLTEARQITKEILMQYNRDIDEELPDFDRNYELLKDKLVNSWGVARRDMPVISPSETKDLMQQLKKGGIDLFAPFTQGHKVTSDELMKNPKEIDYVDLGFKDGEKNDDKVKAKYTKIDTGKLKPIQEQVYLDKVIKNIGKYGAKGSADAVSKLSNIVSKENYILDGHHRYAALMLIDPTRKQAALSIPLPIRDVLDLTLAYGDAIGNERNK